MALILNRVVDGHYTYSAQPAPVPIAFVATAMSLDEKIRGTLTYNVASNITAWIRNNPGAHAKVADLAPAMSQRTRQGLIFGLHYGQLNIQGGRLLVGASRPIARLNGLSDDMDAAQRAARYLGRWLSNGGPPATVLALLGVRV
jgi:hypothetical protein